MKFEAFIRDVPDFPKEGIIFKDITPVLKDADNFAALIDRMAMKWQDMNIDYVVGAESRGFIFGAPLALKLKAGFIPVRKPGKLPYRRMSESYELEYGSDTLEIHEDAIEKGSRVLITDDLLATGGTCAAVVRLVEKLGGEVKGIAFLIELDFLRGRDKMKGYEIDSVIHY